LASQIHAKAVLINMVIAHFCIICYNSYASLLAEEETAHALDSPAHPVEDLGLTRLDAEWQCKHTFCRKWFATPYLTSFL